MPQQAGTAAASTVEPAIHWRTDRMDLQADRLKVQLGDMTFTPEGAEVTLTEDVYRKGNWNLLAHWTADGHDNTLRLRFRSNDSDWYVETLDWWVSDLFMPDGRPGYGEFGRGATNATRTPLSETFTGDLQRPERGSLVPCSPGMSGVREALNVTAYVDIEGLRLTVTPRERSLPDKVLRFFRLDGLLDPPLSVLVPQSAACEGDLGEAQVLGFRVVPRDG